MQLPTIETNRLVLQPWQPEDIDALHELWIDPAVRRYLWDDVIISRARAVAAVHESIACSEERGLVQWAIRLKSVSALIGFCGYRPTEDADVELLYGLAPACWHQGLATEAARAVVRYGVEMLGLVRILATTDAPNTRSVRVLERLGMRPRTCMSIDDDQLRHFVLNREDFRPADATYRLSFT